MGFLTILDETGWEQFKLNFSQPNGFDAKEVAWGNGPPLFPVLVTARYFPTVKRVMCCFVTPDDARNLLTACLGVETPPMAEPIEPGVGSDEVADELARLKKALKQHIQQTRDYMIANNANTRTFLKRAFQTGFYLSMKSYEESLAESTAYIDQMAEERKQNLDAKSLHPEA